MAKFVLKSPQVTINAVDLSDHVESVTVNYSAEIKEQTSSSDATKTKLPGLLDWSMDVAFRQDFAAGSVDATLFPLVGAAAFAVTTRATSAAKAATNPSYEGNALLATYPPMGGKVGDLATTTIKLEGSGALSRVVV